MAATRTPYRTLTGTPTPTPGCGCCPSGVAICTCNINYFDLVTLTLSCPACAALDGKIFVGFAGSPLFGMSSLAVPVGLSTLSRMYLGAVDVATSSCMLWYGTFGGPSPGDFPFGVPPAIACPTVSWTGFLSDFCGNSFLSITATMAPAASNNIVTSVGTCATLALPGCPVMTISNSGGSLNGSWQLVPTFDGLSADGHLTGWVGYPIGTGADLGDGHHMTITLPLSGIHAGNPTVTVIRDSDAATATGTDVGAILSCSPFSITGNMAISGTDAGVVCPNGSFDYAITP